MRRGFVLWSIGLVLALAADGWAGGSALAQAWVPYSPEGGRYNVELPGTPTVSATPITSPSQQTTLTQARVSGPGGVYTVGYIDYPERVALAASSDVMLDKVRDGMAAGNTLRDEQKITLGRAAGRSFTVVEGNGRVNAVRLYWVRNRMYQLSVSGRPEVVKQPDTGRFFDSFAVIRGQR
jgi:hypothetical protein